MTFKSGTPHMHFIWVILYIVQPGLTKTAITQSHTSVLPILNLENLFSILLDCFFFSSGFCLHFPPQHLDFLNFHLNIHLTVEDYDNSYRNEHHTQIARVCSHRHALKQSFQQDCITILVHLIFSVYIVMNLHLMLWLL